MRILCLCETSFNTCEMDEILESRFEMISYNNLHPNSKNITIIPLERCENRKTLSSINFMCSCSKKTLKISVPFPSRTSMTVFKLLFFKYSILKKLFTVPISLSVHFKHPLQVQYALKRNSISCYVASLSYSQPLILQKDQHKKDIRRKCIFSFVPM